MKTIGVEEIDALIADGEYVLDVRMEEERDKGAFIEGAYHIPMNMVGARIDELPKDKTIYIHCAAGMRSAKVCQALELEGFECVNVTGGYNAYHALKKS